MQDGLGEYYEHVARQLLFNDATVIEEQVWMEDDTGEGITIDFRVDGVLYEVKGCRYRIKGLSGRDGACIRTTRMGNYQFKKYQHRILQYHGGYYVLLVMSGDILCRCRVINVDALQIPFNGVATKTISHATLDNWLP